MLPNMALSSTPDITEVRAAMTANSMYAINADVTQAKDYYQAINWLIENLPARAAKGQEEFEYSIPVLMKLRQECLQWLSSQLGYSDADLTYATRKIR